MNEWLFFQLHILCTLTNSTDKIFLPFIDCLTRETMRIGRTGVIMREENHIKRTRKYPQEERKKKLL